MHQEAFTYCWTDKKNNKLYVGTHKGSVDDGYVCSSKTMLAEYTERPCDFSRVVLATGTYKDMIVFEKSILISANASKDESFYNMHNGDGNFYNKGHSKNTIEKLKISRNKRTDKPRLGVPLNDEGRKKASKSAINRSKTDEGKKHLSDAGKKSAEKRKNDPNYKLFLIENAKLLWEKRRLGILPMPQRKKKK